MEILTYATHAQGTLNALVNTHPTIRVGGWGHHWNNTMDKLLFVRDYCKTVPPRTIVIFIDGFDTYINLDPSDAVRRFQEDFDCDVLLSYAKVEKFFPPYLLKTVFGCTHSCPNTGMYMGYAESLIKLLNKAIEFGGDDDQRAVYFASSGNKRVLIDTEMIIFRNLEINEDVEESIDYDAVFIGTPGRIAYGNYKERLYSVRKTFHYVKFFTIELLCIFLGICIGYMYNIPITKATLIILSYMSMHFTGSPYIVFIAMFMLGISLVQ